MTGETPFYANFGYNPLLVGEPMQKHPLAEEAKTLLHDLGQLHQQMANDIGFLNERMAVYYDKKREDTPDLQEGEKVYLLT